MSCIGFLSFLETSLSPETETYILRINLSQILFLRFYSFSNKKRCCEAHAALLITGARSAPKGYIPTALPVHGVGGPATLIKSFI